MHCAHVQTEPLPNISQYYDKEYNANLDSETADDLYAEQNGVSIYRSEHQAAVALQKLSLKPHAKLLDYGAAKAETPRRMLEARSDIELSLFDVSDNYRDYWTKLVPPKRQSSFEIPTAWYGTFDAVTSFFALEHVAAPIPFLTELRQLLAPGGQVYLIVPNVLENSGDFIVVDHVDHFTPPSLRYALESAGFTDLHIDSSAHIAAFVITAKRSERPAAPEPDPSVPQYIAQGQRLADTWRRAAAHVRAFEAVQRAGHRAAIYGSGFYGSFIGSALADRTPIAYFLDRNPHQQAKTVLDRPVIAPESIGDDIEVLYVGLNPARAKDIIAGVPQLHRRSRHIFTLELP
jgi:SAM-dependent methyltransferase